MNRPHHYIIGTSTDGVQVMHLDKDNQGVTRLSLVIPRGGVEATETDGPAIPRAGDVVTLHWTDVTWVTPHGIGAPRTFRYLVTGVRHGIGDASPLLQLHGADVGTGGFLQPHGPFGFAVKQSIPSRMVAWFLGLLLFILGKRGPS